MKNKQIFSLILRYLILLILGLGNFFLIYLIFTPLTVYPVYFILNLFYNINLNNTSLILDSKIIHLIPACIAGTGIYFLLILNLTTPLSFKKRFYSLIISLGSFLILNILRIIFLSILFINSSSSYDFFHKLFWYALSIVFVLGIWFFEIKIFNIRNIPIYTDLKLIFKQTELERFSSIFRKNS